LPTILTIPTRRPAASILPQSLLQLIARAAMATVFLDIGRSRVDGLATLKPTTYALFRHDYSLPFLAPELAAQAITLAEHLLPVLLLVGLFTRASAAVLLAMTLVLDIFMAPSAWPTHLTWIGLLLTLIAHGAGPVSLDHVMQHGED
jgi:putative oxidoreductase